MVSNKEKKDEKVPSQTLSLDLKVSQDVISRALRHVERIENTSRTNANIKAAETSNINTEQERSNADDQIKPEAEVIFTEDIASEIEPALIRPDLEIAPATPHWQSSSGKKNSKYTSSNQHNTKDRKSRYKNISQDDSDREIIKLAKTAKRKDITKTKSYKSSNVIQLHDMMSIKQLSEALNIKFSQTEKMLKQINKNINLESKISYDIAELVALELGLNTSHAKIYDIEAAYITDIENISTNIIHRPPIVAVMGHVDHGKTSLIDVIAQHDVASTESGGITQHVSVYDVIVDEEKHITFIDTPGHAAFSQMRSRGANVTDIAIIIIAADDGVMPQTVESIKYAKAANNTIIVVPTKIDKPEANIAKIKTAIMSHDLVPEESGGNISIVPVSSSTKKNIDKLLETILFHAELMDLKAPFNGPAIGVVLEARMTKLTGPVVTVIIKSGTLKIGNIVACGSKYGKIRSMMDSNGNAIQMATPSMPVHIYGIDGVPETGQRMIVTNSERDAKNICTFNLSSVQEVVEDIEPMDLTNLIANMETDRKTLVLKLIIKADTQGTLEAILNTIYSIHYNGIRVDVIESKVGDITESDITSAKIIGASIVGFNVKISKHCLQILTMNKIRAKTYDIIYNLERDIKDMMSDMLPAIYHEDKTGAADIRNVFTVPKNGVIAGCYIVDGQVNRDDVYKLIRNNEILTVGKIVSIQRLRDSVKSVAKGHECGIKLDNDAQIKVGDKLEIYSVRYEKQIIP